ncbi:hypothetical protein GCM10011506_35660 [Marivirga lumbricoides]|uniref:Uncharacterized protein n=1 Tax=Marivirga lumbricoides TaxID=1046115 RepID=A0ABQ1MYW6_9BACT|nr:hypothetical protein GCM10011506_35660 [Marivirga lumbricoides]
MPIEIKELTIKMTVRDPHNIPSGKREYDPNMEKRIIDASAEKVLRILERKTER